ncbi:hypothetical protein DdX_10772 [Ditylenchus destructor]|uniref:Uncharacterized protein n=1 Tax=Ditylenchus destructor TaxID=166010 RepID=A0AAD4N1H1_9BILA|nr:hypothetical protein DdX_10772 [Ditylenchus destructor]
MTCRGQSRDYVQQGAPLVGDDTTPKLKFYRNDAESVHRNGFDYSLYHELDPPKQIGDFQWHRTYRCSMSVTGQKNCRARIYTSGHGKMKRDMEYQLGIFKNCYHSHESDLDARVDDKEKKGENDIVASARCLTHAKDLDKKEQIRFYKYKVTRVQHNGFVYSYDKDLKSHPKWKHRMHCQRLINGKKRCSGSIWTTGKWKKDDRGREYQIGIIMNGHDHDPLQIAFQGKDNDGESPEAGLKFYKYKEKKVHRDGHVYCLVRKLKSHPLWKHRMRCTRNNKQLPCNGYIWTTGEWETDNLGRFYQRGIPRGEHSHRAFEVLNEDATAHVGGPMEVKQSSDEDDVVMVED